MSFLINPYRFGGAWTPANITTALWLDAADASTITTVSGAVSQWNDKSGNGRNATQGTAANRPALTSAGQNGLNVVTFDGAASPNTDNLALPAGTYSSSPAVFFVLNRGTSVGIPFHLQNTSGIYFGFNFASGAQYIFAKRGSSELAYPTPSAGFHLYHGDSGSSGGATWTQYLNGSLASSVFNYGTAGGTANSNTIGCDPGLANPFNGAIAEIVLVDGGIATLTRQRIEGYLAHKWGLAGSLPAGHPFKSAPPTI